MTPIVFDEETVAKFEDAIHAARYAGSSEVSIQTSHNRFKRDRPEVLSIEEAEELLATAQHIIRSTPTPRFPPNREGREGQ